MFDLLWVTPIKPFGLPLVNTVILIVSGASLTCSHIFLLGRKLLNLSIRFICFYTSFSAIPLVGGNLFLWL